MTTLKINGNTIDNLKSGSLSVNRSFSSPNKATFTIDKSPGVSTPDVRIGHGVTIDNEAGRRIFGGTVEERNFEEVNDRVTWLHLRCTGWQNVALRRRLGLSFSEGTPFNEIIDNIFDAVLSREGITKGAIESFGQEAPRLRFSYNTVAQSLNKISDLLGASWFINSRKELSFFTSPVNALPDLDSSSEVTHENFTEKRGDYRNRQFVRVTYDDEKSYRSETYTLLNSIEDRSMNFDASGIFASARTLEAKGDREPITEYAEIKPADEATYMPALQSSDRHVELSNEVAEIVSVDVEKDYFFDFKVARDKPVVFALTYGAINFEPNNERFWQNIGAVGNLLANDSGEPGNIIELAPFAGDIGDTLKIEYIPKGSATSVAHNTESIEDRSDIEPGTGIYEGMKQESAADDTDAAEKIAKEVVDRKDRFTKEIIYSIKGTPNHSVEPSMSQNVDLGKYGISNETFFVSDVSISDPEREDGSLNYQVTIKTLNQFRDIAEFYSKGQEYNNEGRREFISRPSTSPDVSDPGDPSDDGGLIDSIGLEESQSTEEKESSKIVDGDEEDQTNTPDYEQQPDRSYVEKTSLDTSSFTAINDEDIAYYVVGNKFNDFKSFVAAFSENDRMLGFVKDNDSLEIAGTNVSNVDGQEGRYRVGNKWSTVHNGILYSYRDEDRDNTGVVKVIDLKQTFDNGVYSITDYNYVLDIPAYTDEPLHYSPSKDKMVLIKDGFSNSIDGRSRTFWRVSDDNAYFQDDFFGRENKADDAVSTLSYSIDDRYYRIILIGDTGTPRDGYMEAYSLTSENSKSFNDAAPIIKDKQLYYHYEDVNGAYDIVGFNANPSDSFNGFAKVNSHTSEVLSDDPDQYTITENDLLDDPIFNNFDRSEWVLVFGGA